MESVATAKKTEEEEEEEESTIGDYSNSTAIIPIDCKLSSINFLTSLVQEEPQIRIEDIKLLLNGRITIHVSEYYQFKSSGNRVDLSPQLSEFEGDENPAVECDNLMNGHCPFLNRDSVHKSEQTEAEDVKPTPVQDVQVTNSTSKNEIKAMPKATPKIVENITEENIYLHVLDMEIVPVPSTNTSHSSSPSSVFVSQINRDSTKSIPRTASLLDGKPQPNKTEEVETRNRNSENNSIHIHVDDNKVSHTTKSFAKSQLINTSKYSQQPKTMTINKNKIQITPQVKQKNISGARNQRVNKRIILSRGISKNENHSCSTDSSGRSLLAGAGLPGEFPNTNHTKLLTVTANRKLRSSRPTIRATSVIKNKKILNKSSPRPCPPPPQSKAPSRRSSSRSRINIKDDSKIISENIPEKVNVADEEEIHSPELNSPLKNCSSHSVDLPVPVLENHNGIVQIRTDPLSTELPPPMVYCASDELAIGMFYLASQEGNRLQVMRYNGITFEPYDWSNACKEGVAEGGL